MVAVYNTVTNTTEFFFQGADAAKAASTLLSLSAEQLADLLGISSLESFELDLSSLLPPDSVDEGKSRVVSTVIAVFCANLAAVVVLLAVKTYMGLSLSGIPTHVLASSPPPMAAHGRAGNQLPQQNLADIMDSGGVPPPGAVGVSVGAPPTATVKSPPSAPQKNQTIADLDLDLDLDDVEL